MNLRWNPALHRFEAEFSSDFQGDLAAVKGAGFKTEGAPQWVWFTYKAEPLTKLRANRPASGLTITEDARAQYASLTAMEESNAKVKAELAAQKKALKKESKKKELEGNVPVFPEKGYIDKEDLPPMPPAQTTYVPPPPPETRCIVCREPVYFYERQDPSTCLWCDKIVLDNCAEVC